MTKYNQNFKQQVVDFYFEHHENLPHTLRHFGLNSKTVRRWIAQFKHSGSNGLAVLGRNQIYSPEFKFEVIQAVLQEYFTLEQAALHFGIANSGTLSQWLKGLSKSRYNRASTQTQRSPFNETMADGCH